MWRMWGCGAANVGMWEEPPSGSVQRFAGAGSSAAISMLLSTAALASTAPSCGTDRSDDTFPACTDLQPPSSWSNPTCHDQATKTDNCARARAGEAFLFANEGYCHESCGLCARCLGDDANACIPEDLSASCTTPLDFVLIVDTSSGMQSKMDSVDSFMLTQANLVTDAGTVSRLYTKAESWCGYGIDVDEEHAMFV